MAVKLYRGAYPSPRHKIIAAEPHVAPNIALPPSFGYLPPKLSYWGNNQYGDCVSAEEAAAKTMASYGSGTEIFVPDNNVINWASQHGFLNGADLVSVMEAMAQSGMVADDGKTYKDGGYKSVNYQDYNSTCAAIYQSPVKIAVAADQLESSVHGGGGSWVGFGYSNDHNTDHCVNLCGFGSMLALCQMTKQQVPAGVDATAASYLLFTWDSIGVIDAQSVVAISSEAWLRDFVVPVQNPDWHHFLAEHKRRKKHAA
jgi:hypothetical protein